jgi:hypothetical protein
VITRNLVTSLEASLIQKKLTLETVVIYGNSLDELWAITQTTEEKKAIDSLSLPWLTLAPESIIKKLPNRWKNNLLVFYKGTTLTFFTLDRSDLIKCLGTADAEPLPVLD